MKDQHDNRDKPPKPSGRRPDKPLDSEGKLPELGGRDGPEPTRYGDWEVNGICTDF